MASAATQLRIPSTQNTAPVLEFRCLYTHDLRQKKKRWQDGFLRFHTFNKRVMVYDEPRNFIGDTHWREEEVVQDGAELRLDKGVLVEVGEAVGTIEQDLTELLERARPTQDRSVVDAYSRSKYPTTVKSTTMPLAQLRPKSLNALLGTPRGAYGRAIVPDKSPFESRSTGVDLLQEVERPTKRQKLGTGMETITTTAPAAPAPCKILPSGLQTNTLRPTASRIAKLPKPVEQELISIDSDEDEIISSSPAKPADSSLVVPSESMPRLSTTPRASPKSMSKDHKPSAAPLRNSSKATRTSSVHDQQAARNETLSNTEGQRPVNRLRSAVTKSRRKLMYHELLRPQAASKSPHTDTRIHTTTEVEESIGSNICCSTTDSHSSSIPFLGNHFNAARTSSQTASANADTSITEFFPAGKLSSSEEDRQHIRIDDERQPIFISQGFPPETDANMEFTPMDQIPLVPRKPIPTPKSKYPTTAQHLQRMGRNFTLGNNCIPTHNAESQIQPPGPQLAQTPLTTEALDKPCRSARVRGVPIEPHVLPSPQPLHRSPLKKALSESNGSEKSTRTLPIKVSLQRASSDLSRVCRTSFMTENTVKEGALVQDKDLGPWGREAFDLFGWRPGDGKGLVELRP